MDDCATKALSAAGGAVPFDVFAGAEEEVVGAAVGGEPGGDLGEGGLVGALGHEEDAGAVGLWKFGEPGLEGVAIGGGVDDEF